MEYKKIKDYIKNELLAVEGIIFDTSSNDTNLDLAGLVTLNAKRLRPVLGILFIKACDLEITKEQFKILAATEILHNATLVHDDIIDKADFRRDTKTLNKKYDNNLAVLAGDFLLSIAMKLLLKANSLEVLSIYCNTIREMCTGEINQYFSKFKMPTIEEYIKKTTQKTALLFESELESIMLNTNFREQAKDFALNFGIAFQIRDDILNVIGSDSLKPAQNDIEEGIYTAPVIFAGGTENIQNGIEKSIDLMDNYFENARRILNHMPQNDYTNLLRELLDIFNYDEKLGRKNKTYS